MSISDFLSKLFLGALGETLYMTLVPTVLATALGETLYMTLVPTVLATIIGFVMAH